MPFWTNGESVPHVKKLWLLPVFLTNAANLPPGKSSLLFYKKIVRMVLDGQNRWIDSSALVARYGNHEQIVQSETIDLSPTRSEMFSVSIF